MKLICPAARPRPCSRTSRTCACKRCPEGFVAVLRDLHQEREGDETGCGTFAVERFGGVAQDLELVEDRARLMQEEIAARLNEQTNRTLYFLSVVTAALLPITLITGVFGMNVGGLPWLEHPHGFRHVMLLMVLMVVAALGLIRHRRVF